MRRGIRPAWIGPLRHWLGRPGLIGLLLIGLAAIGIGGIAWQAEQLAAARAGLARAESSRFAVLGTQDASAALRTPADAMLPRASELPALLRELHRLAGLLALELPRGQYRWVAPGDSTPAAYEIEFPLKAPYAKVRPFLTMVLNSVPALALRDLSFRRATPEQTDLDTVIRFVVFLRSEAP